MGMKLVLWRIEDPQTVSWKSAMLVFGHECEARFVDVERRHDCEVAGLKSMVLLLEERMNARILEMGKLYDKELEVLAKALEVSLLSASHVESLPN